MYKTLYTILIFFLAVVYCQTSSADVFFLDMGIAIEPKNGSEKISRQLIKPCLLYTSPSPRDQRGAAGPG